MCYDKNGKVLAQGFYGLHYGLFGVVVEGAGGFVEDYDVGLFVEGSGYADPLALASGEADAAFAYVGFVFFWPGFDDVGYLCLPGGLLDLLVVDFIFWDAEGYVFFDGAVGEEDGLGNVGYVRLPGSMVGCGDGLFVYLEGASSGLQEAHDDVEQGAFAAAGDADEAYATAFFYCEVQVV